MTKKEEALTDLVLAVFRLNGSLIDAGNLLVRDIGLTSAWWQVLGALHMSPEPLPVAHIARNMGLSRQAVQRIVDLLADKGLVQFKVNPHHQRAKLVVLTAEGRATMRAAERLQSPWARDMAAGLTLEHIRTALDVLKHLDGRLNSDDDENFNSRGVAG